MAAEGTATATPHRTTTPIYRMAYDVAAALAELCGHMGVGRDRLCPRTGDDSAVILAEVARRLGVPAERVRAAVEDALAGRRPRG